MSEGVKFCGQVFGKSVRLIFINIYIFQFLRVLITTKCKHLVSVCLFCFPCVLLFLYQVLIKRCRLISITFSLVKKINKVLQLKQTRENTSNAQSCIIIAMSVLSLRTKNENVLYLQTIAIDKELQHNLLCLLLSWGLINQSTRFPSYDRCFLLILSQKIF